MDLHAVKASGDGVSGRLRIVSHIVPDLLLGQRAWSGMLAVHGDIAAAHHAFLYAFFCQQFSLSGTTQGPQLEEYGTAVLVDRVGYILPGGDLGFVPDAGDVAHAASACRDEGGFRDKEGARRGGALGVVFGGERAVDMGLTGTYPSERSHDDTVGKAS